MIQVQINRNHIDTISSFKVEGHANYNSGNDIVCSAVSAITIGTVNALVGQSLIKPPKTTHHSGYLKAIFDVADWHNGKAQLILESMVHMLKNIESTYQNHVTVNDSKEVSMC